MTPCARGQIHVVPRSGHNTRGLRRLENVGGAVGWVVGIHRYPRLRRPWQSRTDRPSSPKTCGSTVLQAIRAQQTHGDELTSQTICARVEFGVREAGAFENDSGGIGSSLDLTLECFGDGLRGNVEAGAVPQGNLVSLLVGCDRKIPDLAARFGRDELLEKLYEPRVISLGVRGRVQIGIRLEKSMCVRVSPTL